jgi:hypothetical protein
VAEDVIPAAAESGKLHVLLQLLDQLYVVPLAGGMCKSLLRHLLLGSLWT